MVVGTAKVNVAIGRKAGRLGNEVHEEGAAEVATGAEGEGARASKVVQLVPEGAVDGLRCRSRHAFGTSRGIYAFYASLSLNLMSGGKLHETNAR